MICIQFDSSVQCVKSRYYIYENFNVLSLDDFSRSTLQDVVDRYFGSSIKASVSALVDNEKLSDDEIRELIEMVIKHRNDNKK